MFLIEGLVVYYTIAQFLSDMFNFPRPFTGGVETIILIGAAVVAYSEYTKTQKAKGDSSAMHDIVLDNTARDCVAALAYGVLALAFTQYWAFFLSCSMLAGCFYLYRRRLCKKWVA